eukprot:m.252934 g.252934  ORF g.252934 m.252934 type:complete len:54 (-) comp17191_c0_seq15:1034-1195(-)
MLARADTHFPETTGANITEFQDIMMETICANENDVFDDILMTIEENNFELLDF